MRAPIKLNLWADDGAGGCGNEDEPGGGAVGRTAGLPPAALGGGDEGDSLGACECFGDGDGDGAILFSGGEEAGRGAEGLGGGDGTEGVVEGGGGTAARGGGGGGGSVGMTGGGGGGSEGMTGGGGAEAAMVSIWSFMPPRQCPPFPQMKYLVPAEVRDMKAEPPV